MTNHRPSASDMTPGRRGWVVVLIFTTVAVLASWNASASKRDSMWRGDWTRAHVVSDCKGDKAR